MTVLEITEETAICAPAESVGAVGASSLVDDHKNSKEIIKSELFATSGRRMRRPHYFATQDRPPNRPNRLRHGNSEEYAAAGWWLARVPRRGASRPSITVVCLLG